LCSARKRGFCGCNIKVRKITENLDNVRLLSDRAKFSLRAGDLSVEIDNHGVLMRKLGMKTFEEMLIKLTSLGKE
jgi:hypothetical protein